MKTKLLFVCSGNLDRSPTAEELFHNSNLYEAKSAGTHPEAVVHINQNLIDWADKIFAMSEREDGHLTYLKEHFNLRSVPVIDLDITDKYDKNEPELIKLIKEKLSPYLSL